jgi:cell division protein FtsB
MAKQKIINKQSIIFFFLSLVFIQVILQIFVFENGLRTSIKLVKAKEVLQSELTLVEASNRKLARSIKDIKSSPDRLEEQARYRLGLVGDKESFAIMMREKQEVKLSE